MTQHTTEAAAAPLRIGMIGCGNISRRYVDAFKVLGDRIEVVGAADVNLEAARIRGEEAGARVITDDWRQLLDHVDAVTIATPHDQHFTIGMAAVAAGKHVFMEKPVSMTEADGLALIDAAETAGVTLMTGYPLPYHPVVERIQQAIDSGEFGRPIHFSLSTQQWLELPPGHWRGSAASRGGGSLFSHGCHYIDLLLRFLGAPAVGTHLGTSFATPWEAAGDTTSHAVMKFESGALGHHFSTEVANREAGGSFFIGHFEKATLEASLTTGRLEATSPSGTVCLLETEPRVKYLHHELAHFAECARTGARPRTDGRRSLQSLRVIWRMYEAERDGVVADLHGLGLDSV